MNINIDPEEIIKNMNINKIVIDKILEDSLLDDIINETIENGEYNISIKKKIGDIIVEYLSSTKGKDLIIKSIDEYFENNNISDIEGVGETLEKFILKIIKSKLLKNEFLTS